MMTKLSAMLALTTAMALATGAMAQEGEPIKIGVLHSLSGTMAISETTLKDTVLMMVEQQNAKGGLLGKKIEAVVVDPASDWPLFAEKARELISVQGVGARVALAILGTLGPEGLGRALMDQMMHTVDLLGGPCFLEVRVDNTPAIRLYESFGFFTAGVRKNYYQASGTDAYTMTRPRKSERRDE